MEVEEPTNVERYYILIMAGEQDGKKGKVKIKKWAKNGKTYEKVIGFTPHPWEVNNEVSTEAAQIVDDFDAE